MVYKYVLPCAYLKQGQGSAALVTFENRFFTLEKKTINYQNLFDANQKKMHPSLNVSLGLINAGIFFKKQPLQKFLFHA